jgi:preprotein translocase subunit YajC
LPELALHILAADGVSGTGFLIPLLLVGLIFYFIVIRPQSKERKQRETQLKAIKKHDKVVTNAGIHGVVVALDEDTVTLRVDDKNNVRMRFSRSSIWQIQTDDESAKPTGAPEK